MILVKISSEFKNSTRLGHMTDDITPLKVTKMHFSQKYLPATYFLLPYV